MCYNPDDNHLHVIPNVDDGAGSMEESIAELKMVIRQGVRRVIATPHSFAFDDYPEKVHSQYFKKNAVSVWSQNRLYLHGVFALAANSVCM